MNIFKKKQSALFYLLFIIYRFSTLDIEGKEKLVAYFVTYLIKNKKRCQETLYSPIFFVSLPYKTINSHITVVIMGKGKKGGKRMNKAQLTEILQQFFAERPGETLSFKEIFRSLHLTTCLL